MYRTREYISSILDRPLQFNFTHPVPRPLFPGEKQLCRFFLSFVRSFFLSLFFSRAAEVRERVAGGKEGKRKKRKEGGGKRRG